MQNNTQSNTAHWSSEVMRTGSHLPPLMPQPQASARSARASVTMSHRPISMMRFDPLSSMNVATGPVEVPPQIGYFSATPFRPHKAAKVFSDINDPGNDRFAWNDKIKVGDSFTKQVVVPKYNPTEWIHEEDEDEAFADQPGHAAYYKSQTYQDKVAHGKVQIPGGVRASPAASRKDAVKARRAESEPLVMIFGLDNVRRTRTEKKCDLRLQKHNKRAKWLRKADGTKSKFGWD